MGLLGIDVGTTGCKAVVFDEQGTELGSHYREYNISSPRHREAELDSENVWNAIFQTIKGAVAASGNTTVTALSVTTMGEAVVPVGAKGKVLGPSIMNIDIRGEEYVSEIASGISPEDLHRVNGNILANQYTLTKLMWLKNHDPSLYDKTECFMPWSTFVSTRLGAEACVDYSLAARTLLFDLDTGDWSDRLLGIGGIDREKLPKPVPAGTAVGTVSPGVAEELGLSTGTVIVMGPHDQCANSIGAGSVRTGMAMYGMGTFPCITPVYGERPSPAAMLANGLNIEHHAVPGLWVSFIYHMGGASIKWYRDKIHGNPKASYDKLFSEMPDEIGPLLVLPHLSPMGPPDFISDSNGVILGLTTETERGAILRGIIESNALALKRVTRELPAVGIGIDELRAVGGGSRSSQALQINADILGIPIACSDVTEAGALGAAILAGTGTGVYGSAEEAADSLVRIKHRIEPQKEAVSRYEELFGMYEELRKTILPLTRDWTSR